MFNTISSRSRQFTTPIPTFLSDKEVITGLYDHNNVLTLQALIIGHKEVDPENYPAALTDPYFFPADRAAAPVKCYEVTEGVIVIPGIGDWGKKFINFPAWFQDTPDGLHVRAYPPGGVMVRAEWRLEHASSGGGGDGSDTDGVEEQAEFQLVEDLTVECASWMMPFVGMTVEGAHRDICWKLVEKLAAEKRAKEHDTLGR